MSSPWGSENPLYCSHGALDLNRVLEISESELISPHWHMPPLASGGLLRAAQRIPLGRGISDMRFHALTSQFVSQYGSYRLQPAPQQLGPARSESPKGSGEQPSRVSPREVPACHCHTVQPTGDVSKKCPATPPTGPGSAGPVNLPHRLSLCDVCKLLAGSCR